MNDSKTPSSQASSPDHTAPPPPEQNPTRDEAIWAMAAHMAGLIGIIGPLLVWLIKRQDMPFVDDQAKEALNFQINVAIATLLASVLVYFVIGILLLPLIVMAWFAFLIIGAAKAHRGEHYRYPYIYRLIE